MIAIIVGARPNFMKVAPLIRELEKQNKEFVLIHTGQHQGVMADAFIEEFGLTVDYQLTHPALEALTLLLSDLQPTCVVVVGDVDSSLDGAIAAKVNGLKLAHIEAGLRSFDNTMKEERNRIVIDSLSDMLFVSEVAGLKNLARENIRGQAYFVGNIMIDNLTRFGLVTLHRPSNVDNRDRLFQILESLKRTQRELIWPLHPRTQANLLKFELKLPTNISIYPPANHEQLVQLIKESEFVITDSGGIQEEAVYLGRRVYTMRDNTERPITLQYGNQLVSPDTLNIPIIPNWDGQTAERIVNLL